MQTDPVFAALRYAHSEQEKTGDGPFVSVPLFHGNRGTETKGPSPKHQSPLFWSAKILMTRFPFGSLKFSQLPLRNTRTGPSFALRESSDD